MKQIIFNVSVQFATDWSNNEEAIRDVIEIINLELQRTALESSPQLIIPDRIEIVSVEDDDNDNDWIDMEDNEDRYQGELDGKDVKLVFQDEIWEIQTPDGESTGYSFCELEEADNFCIEHNINIISREGLDDDEDDEDEE